MGKRKSHPNFDARQDKRCRPANVCFVLTATEVLHLPQMA
jgi:hypothetical protein